MHNFSFVYNFLAFKHEKHENLNLVKCHNYFQRLKVSCRAGAERVEAKGVFVGAEVVRGPNWRFGDQDGER